MTGTASGAGNLSEEMSSGHRCQSGEAITEWRSSEQLENGTPSTSPPYWDSDDENDSGPKPADLYGKYTWKIEKFSHINKRELRSSAFEVGSYKWYILIYPQGCDVCNHLSLFLCVANHDKLLPGWSHFAQFTIAVVNKDPKKSKYSDTLHRFWKKEHDWGWKKFMELSKVLDGFVEEDTLIIKAQVQVIREKADRPFRCLDCQYRRELVRVYLTNVEQICRRFVEERRSKLVKLIEDKEGWSSFRDFWSDTDKAARLRMCREKTDMILKVVVKHFFIEKEVTSTLVMDSLYSGLKALEGQTKFQKNKAKLMDIEEMPAPIIRVEQDMFVLVDDVLLLLERAAMEPLPPKDDKGPQNRTKDGSSGDDSNKDSIERDERRLTELGRRTVEIFVLAHIFSNKIEVAYKEAVAWKRQDELIREEAAAGPVDCKPKSKRGAAEKEKKSKKKQAKQKRNSRKMKDKVKDDKSDVTAQDKQLQEIIDDDTKDFVIEEVQPVHQKCDMPEDTSDVSDSVDFVAEETVHPDSEDRDASPVNWDTDTSEVLPHTEASISPSSMQNGIPDRKSPSVIDDSSSTCSTDSVPSVVANGPYRGSSFYQHKSEKSTGRGKNRQSRGVVEGPTRGCEVESHPSEDPNDAGPLNTESENHKVNEPEESETVVLLQDRIKWLEQHVVKKEEEVDPLQKKLSVKEQVDKERPKDERLLIVPSSPRSPPKSIPSPVRVRSESKNNANPDLESLRKPFPHNAVQTEGASSLVSSFQSVAVSKLELKAETPKSSEKPSIRQVLSTSRPSSAPLVPAPRPTAPAMSTVQTIPPLARSVSAAGRLGPDPSSSSSSAQSSVPQSYRNVMMGNAGVSSSVYTNPQPPSSPVNQSSTYSQPSLLTSSPLFIPQSPDRVNLGSFRPGFSFGTTSRDVSQHTPHWMEGSPQHIRIRHSEHSPHLNDVQSMNPYRSLQSGSQGRLSAEFPVGPSGRQIPSALGDEFPHLDIINDLLDDESSMGRTERPIDAFHRPHMLNRHFSFPGDLVTSSEDSSTSSCRLERTQSHYDASYQRTYSSLGNHYVPLLEATQSNPILYSSDQVDAVIPNHWQLAGSDISMLARLNADAVGNMPDYTNIGNGVNGYSVFGPSNGH